MKHLFIIFSAIIFLSGKIYAQNVGIGQPAPQQKLDVNGAIKIGTTTTNNAGTIRYNNGVFEGGNGTNWKTLQGLPAGTIVMSETISNSSLENYGFTLFGYTDTLAAKKVEFPSVPPYTWFPTTRITTLAPDFSTRSAFACWTGSHMLIYAGPSNARKYDPVADTWSTINLSGAPAIADFGYAVWTGSEMLVYHTGNGAGAKYNPVTDTWTAMSSVGGPNAPREWASVIWTGTEMIIWGGYSFNASIYLNTGYRYNPSTNTWTTTSNSSPPAARFRHTAVWAGNRMIIWGGNNNGSQLQTGAKYNPTTDNWTTATSLVSAPAARDDHTAVWTGTEMIIYGGGTDPGGKYNSGTDTWSSMSALSSPHTAGYYAFWNAGVMYVWGGFQNSNLSNTLYYYSPGSDNWTTVATTPNTPTARKVPLGVFNGFRMIIWGGENLLGGSLYTGARYNFFTAYNETIDTKTPLYLFIKN